MADDPIDPALLNIDVQIQARLDTMDAKLDRVLAAIFGGVDNDARPFKVRVEDLEERQTGIAARVVALEAADRARAAAVAVGAHRFGLIEKIVFGVIALALTAIAMTLIRIVVTAVP